MFEKISSLIRNAGSPDKMSLTDKELRVLESKLNVCSGNISNALFEMIRIKVDTSPSLIKVTPLKNVPGLMGSDKNITVLYNGIIGTSNGSVMLSAPLNEIIKMSEIFLHKQHGYFKELNSENLSVIKELSTILAGYYITALNELTDGSYAILKPTLSVGSHGMADKLIENLNMNPESSKIDVLIFEKDFFVESENITIRALLLLKKDDVLKMVKIIDTK